MLHKKYFFNTAAGKVCVKVSKYVDGEVDYGHYGVANRRRTDVSLLLAWTKLVQVRHMAAYCDNQC